MISKIRLGLCSIMTLVAAHADADWGAETVKEEEWYRSSYSLVAGSVAYRSSPSENFSEGYYPTQTLDAGGYHVRQIFDYAGEYTAGYLYERIAQRVNEQGFELLYTCKGVNCGDIAGWQLLTDRLLDGDSATQSYLVGHNPLGGENGTYVAIHVADLDNRPRAVIDVIFSDPGLRQTLDLANAQIVPVYSQSDVLEGSKIYFDRNSSEIPERMEAVITSLGESLQSKSGMQLVIVGHADGTGTYDYNLRLSRSRAEAVKQRLADTGLNVAQAEVAGVGSAMSGSHADNQSNRRVEVVVRPL